MAKEWTEMTDGEKAQSDPARYGAEYERKRQGKLDRLLTLLPDPANEKAWKLVWERLYG